jgi:hypothetical protein
MWVITGPTKQFPTTAAEVKKKIVMDNKDLPIGSELALFYSIG